MQRGYKRLTGCLRQLLEQWKDYRLLLDHTSQSFYLSYRAPLRETGSAKIRNRQGTT